MTIDPAELVNLDVTIAKFITPRLEAFKAAADSFPADLDDMAAWHAELDQMIAAFAVMLGLADPLGETNVPYTPTHQARLALFVKRLGYLWQ